MFLGCFAAIDAFSEEDNEILKRYVDFENIEESNRHLASPLTNVEVLSKAYGYVFNPQNKLIKYSPEFYSVNLFVLKDGYAVHFFIPFKRGVLVEPWSKYHNYVAVYIDGSRSSVKQISNEQLNDLVRNK